MQAAWRLDAPPRLGLGRRARQPGVRPGARETARRMQAAMQVNHVRAAGPLMQVIDVLGDQRELGYPPRQLNNGPVRRVGLRL
ncbi:hypothetical protein D3C77_673040 [compost metagenome]